MEVLGGMEHLLDSAQRCRFEEAGRPWIPAADVADHGEHIAIHLEVPGIDPREISVVQREHLVIIQGHRHRPSGGDATFIQMEIQDGPFERVFEFSDYLDLNDIMAEYRLGVLTVRIRKSPLPPKQALVKNIRIEGIS